MYFTIPIYNIKFYALKKLLTQVCTTAHNIQVICMYLAHTMENKQTDSRITGLHQNTETKISWSRNEKSKI